MIELIAGILFLIFVGSALYFGSKAEPGPCPECGTKRTAMDFWDSRCKSIMCPNPECKHVEKFR